MTDARATRESVFANTSCVHCGAVVAMGSPTCDECGASLESHGSPLFSTVAADYAEVVSDQPRAPESIWSTAANAADVGVSDSDVIVEEEAGVGEILDDRVEPEPEVGGAHTNGTPPPEWTAAPENNGGTVFTAEPTRRADDVVDEPDDDLVDVWDEVDPVPQPSPFSSGSAADDASTEPQGRRASAFGRGGTTQDPWVSTTDTTDGPTGPAAAPGPFGRQDQGTPSPPPFSGAPDATERDQGSRQSGSTWSYTLRAGQHEEPAVDDPHGFGAAISRLSRGDQDAAGVALTVAGALLAEYEHVRGVVTGHMLGHPAAVVVTDSRVLVVNDRRWDPIVDSYAIDASLVVRGRHDGQVAAMNFADDDKFSMVDAIHDVSLSIELADTIRNTQPQPPGH